MSFDKAIAKKVVVKLGEEKVEVKKLPLGKYAELMLALRNMPTEVIGDLQNLDETNSEATIQAMFGIFAKAWGQLIEIIAIGSGVDKDRLENDPEIGLDGGIALFLAIYEVNNLQAVVKQVKNVIKRASM